MVLVAAYLMSYAWALYWTHWSSLKHSGFLSAHQTIDDTHTLSKYKQMVRTDMNLALLNIGVLGVGFIIGMVIVFRHGVFGLLLILGANGVLLAIGARAKKAERLVKSLPTANQQLADEYQRVNQSWAKKALPDF